MSHFKLIFSIFAIAIGAFFLALFAFILPLSETSHAIAQEETSSHFEKNQEPDNSEERFTPKQKFTLEQEKLIRRAIELFSKKESSKGLDLRQLIPLSFKTDRGIDHIKFDQKHPSGVTVFKGRVGLHIKDDRISFISGSFEKGLEKIEIKPTISAQETVEVAQRFLEGELKRNMELPEKPAELFILPSALSDDGPHLVWHVVIKEPYHEWNVFVDAHRGEVIFHYDTVRTSTGVGSGFYTGVVYFPTETDKSSSMFVMEDSDLNIDIVKVSTYGNTWQTTPFDDSDDRWGGVSGSDDQKPAVDAYHHARVTYAFYLDVFFRVGIFDDGYARTLHLAIEDNYDNARWTGNYAVFGTGDGLDLGPLPTLDIVAHEITHGVTEYTANLVYHNESGGLNEAFSDIMAACTEFYAFRKGYRPWWIGEDTCTPRLSGDAFRYMDDPLHNGRAIDHYSLYTSGMNVHDSSGIANNAFYLLVHGGINQTSGIPVNQPIGIDAAQQIFYHTLVHYLTPYSSFHDCALATIQSANDIYGQLHPEYSGAVIQAWRAVGVFPSLSFGETLLIDGDADFPPE